jgi:D-serine deaminase-like pyridoxal phosphate-dependent protein
MPVDHGGQLTARGAAAPAPPTAATAPAKAGTVPTQATTAKATTAKAGTARAAVAVGEAKALRARYDQATAALDPPLAIVDEGAFDRNAADLTRRAANRPIRVATKSLRCRFLIERALACPGYQGVMCYSLPEALWLHAMGTCDDLLVAYPTVDRQALRTLAADAQARQHITIMVDSTAQLDVVDRALGEDHPEIRVCLELDVSWRPLARKPLVHIGT